jgi:CDP-glucose 4,6-dehydratase
MENMVMSIVSVNPEFWKNKSVFLTGHTGFKGGWLALWLSSMGAKVTGYALTPNTAPNLFDVLSLQTVLNKSHIANICDLEDLQIALSTCKPEIVIHMAAQPLVRYSYANPVETYMTNVMGTVNVLEATRKTDSVKATVVVTTDKCYENKEWVWGYRENEPMGGFDPYSSSKGCAELVTSAYRQSYFSDPSGTKNSVASARAGNVIGGGDWSEDRLIPDAVKAFEVGQTLMIRNPLATRPWQHVLEPLSGYLILAQSLYQDGEAFSSAWNFGPKDQDNRSVKEVITTLCKQWGPDARWQQDVSAQPHEAGLLKLDCSKAAKQLGWEPKWGLETAIEKIIYWHKAYLAKENMQEVSLAQIDHYMSSKS